MSFLVFFSCQASKVIEQREVHYARTFRGDFEEPKFKSTFLIGRTECRITGFILNFHPEQLCGFGDDFYIFINILTFRYSIDALIL